ncbi:hypothetical protein ACIGO9_19870 [Nocardia asteroides]|uniref:hypothetical protein n=1 Tax=Nocardia asteroides TaxID=1824 RepID=UPI0037C64CF8
MKPIAVPESMRLTQPTVDAGRLVPGEAGLPWLIGGSYAEPGRPGTPAVWLSDDAAVWSRAPVTDAVEGDFDGWAEGSAELTALAGSVWHDGLRTNKLWTSTDRRHWRERVLPQALTGGTEVTNLSVDGTSVVLLGTDSDGEQALLRLDANDSVTSVPLPAVASGERLAGWELVAAGPTVVLLASTGPEGATTAPVIYQSGDSGKSWSSRIRLTGDRGYFGGLTRTPDGFSLVGSVRADNGPNAPALPAAWRSPDGVSWTPERVPVPSEETDLAPASGVSLRSPIAANGTVTAIGQGPDAPVAGLYRRNGDGSWELAGTTDNNKYSGAHGSVVAQPDGSMVGLIDDGGVRIGRLTADRTWTDLQRLSSRAVPFAWPIVLDPARRLLRTGRSVWQVEPNGRRSRSGEFTLVTLQGDSAIETDWQPRAAESMHGALLSTGPDGVEVVLGAEYDPATGSAPARGSWRSPNVADWQSVSGFDSETTLDLDSLDHFGDRWILTARGRPDVGFTTRSSAQIWSSLDGTVWHQMPVQTDGELSSRINDVCATPTGDPIAVGWVERSPGIAVPAAWRLDGLWQRLNLGPFDDIDGQLSGCAAGPSGIVAEGTVDGRSAILQSITGDDWQRTVELARGESLSDVTARPAGFIAGGRLQQAGMSAPALWVSRDGRTWKPVRVPSFGPATARIGDLGNGEIAVFLPADAGDPISVIGDVDSLINEYGG